MMVRQSHPAQGTGSAQLRLTRAVLGGAAGRPVSGGGEGGRPPGPRGSQAGVRSPEGVLAAGPAGGRNQTCGQDRWVPWTWKRQKPLSWRAVPWGWPDPCPPFALRTAPPHFRPSWEMARPYLRLCYQSSWHAVPAHSLGRWRASRPRCPALAGSLPRLCRGGGRAGGLVPGLSGLGSVGEDDLHPGPAQPREISRFRVPATAHEAGASGTGQSP